MLKKINILRRKITKLFTKNIGKIDYPIIPIEKAEIKKILICRPNHRLGNQILLASLIQELEQIFPNCKIDLFVKGNLSKIIYKNYDSIDTIILLPKKHFKNLVQYLHGWIKLRSKKYDLAINVINYSSSGRLSTKFSNAKYKFYGGEPIYCLYSHLLISDYGCKFLSEAHWKNLRQINLGICFAI